MGRLVKADELKAIYSLLIYQSRNHQNSHAKCVL